MSNWSHRVGLMVKQAWPFDLPVAGWCDRPRPPASQPGRKRHSDGPAHRAGFPQGFISQKTDARLAIDRIVKEPLAPTPPAGATSPLGCHAGRKLGTGATAEGLLWLSITGPVGQSSPPRFHGRQGK